MTARAGSRFVGVELPTGATRSYRIDIGRGAAERAASDLPALAPGVRQALLAIDAGVPPAFVDRIDVSARAAGLRTRPALLEASERAKSIESAERLLLALAGGAGDGGASFGRTDAVIAIGGGIVGDVAGFAAASYQRGIAVIQCPTTLLAMVDSSVGGKTGVNLMLPGPAGEGGLLKNYVGAFHQPARVAADVGVLASLPERVLRCGAAECIKHGMLSGPFGDPDLLAWTVDRAGDVAGRDEGVLAELVERNVRVKAAVVAGDERELSRVGGGRALLNLGHTFAHAMETLDGLTLINADGRETAGPPMHGEAVALGLIAAHGAARRLGLIGESRVCVARDAIEAFGLPVRAAGLPCDEALFERMLRDKKVLSGSLRLVLPVDDERGVACRVTELSAPDAVYAGWAAIRASGRV